MADLKALMSWLGLVFLALTFASPASADISISPAVIVFDNSATEQTIIVTNEGKDLAFVTAKVRSVEAPGEGDEKLHFDPNPARIGLLATPNRLVLEPGEQRAIKLLATNGAGPSDRVWRVQIAPAVGQLKQGQSGIAFIIAYDALIIQRAVQAKPTVSGQRSGKSLTLMNNGNSFAMISTQQCRSGACKELVKKRLYAGKSWTEELPDAISPVTVMIEGVGGRKETLRF
jgi:P pilus assembly chaperone PapD